MSSIFVSYRRADAPAHAGRIYDRLVERLGKENVYKDLDSTAPGADFVEVINETIAGCDALVAVIGQGWLSASRGRRRGRRLDDPQDWVRREIAAALQRNIRVVPVLVEGARMPPLNELPDDIKPLARRHAVELSETAWAPQLAQLIDSLAPPPSVTAPTQPRAPASGDPNEARLKASASRRLGTAATAFLLCAFVVGAVVVLAGGDDEGAGSGTRTAERARAPALTPAEYRLRLARICVDYDREAQRIGEAEGERPVFGPIMQLETKADDQLRALRPPASLESDHRTVLALWGRRVTLMGYYYDRYRREYRDPEFRTEFERQMRRVDRLSQAVQKRFAALGVTPECNLFV